MVTSFPVKLRYISNKKFCYFQIVGLRKIQFYQQDGQFALQYIFFTLSRGAMPSSREEKKIGEKNYGHP